MEPKGQHGTNRFGLITAGHHFLMNSLPPAEGNCHAALETFMAVLETTPLSRADIDAVLIRCLAVIDRRGEVRIPSLVDRYVESTFSRDPLSQFRTCVEDFLTHHDIRDGSIQQAVELVRARFGDPALDPRSVAEALNLRLSVLAVSFRRHMGCTLTEHIRAVRLDQAAVLLATTSKSIKEIWAATGYNHHSNFDRDFKSRFATSPTEFRGRSLRPMAQAHYCRHVSPDRSRHAHPAEAAKPSVLIVDDDECTRTTLGIHFQQEGRQVWLAAKGVEGLEIVKYRFPDAVLVDFHLGDMTGLEFLRALRRDVPGNAPGAAVFTADWDVFALVDQFHALKATIASKLCDLEHVSDLIDLITGSAE